MLIRTKAYNYIYNIYEQYSDPKYHENLFKSVCIWREKNGSTYIRYKYRKYGPNLVFQRIQYWLHVSDTECIFPILNMYFRYWICVSDTEYVFPILNMYFWYWICVSDTKYVFPILNMYFWYWICISDTEHVILILNMYFWY